MPTYVKRLWNHLRGDEHDAWGTSWWYFEVDEEGEVLRQIEQYDSGICLRYSEQHLEDEFGVLGQARWIYRSPGTLQSHHKISRQLGATRRYAATG
jgi:hypothetical protein